MDRKLAASLIATLAAAHAPLHAAPDLEAGKAKAQAVCAACHGANGVSVSDSIPNLAGQRSAYLENQLKAWKSGTRKNPVMNAIGAQLSGDEMGNLAAYFASLPPAGGAAKSEFMAALAKSPVSVCLPRCAVARAVTPSKRATMTTAPITPAHTRRLLRKLLRNQLIGTPPSDSCRRSC